MSSFNWKRSLGRGESEEGETKMQRRMLGKTGAVLSVIGVGGLVPTGEKPSRVSQIVARAVDRGVDFFDTGPCYSDSEELLGPALRPYRKSVFLACKTDGRTSKEALRELHQSMRRLETDYFDLYQLHGVVTLEEVAQITGPKGALETLVKAQEQGLARYLGFSAHSEEAALALLDQFDFDSVLFPFNWVSWHQGNFGPAVLARAQQKGVGILAIKALAKRKLGEGEKKRWPKCWYVPVDSRDEASLALRFVLSKPVTSAVSPSHAEFLWWACDIADRFEPLSREEEELVAKSSEGLEPIFTKDRA